MVAQTKPRRFTPEEYLDSERDAETRSEYEDGVILAMAGASLEHVTITYNFGAELRQQLRHAGCRGFSPDLRVRVLAGNRYYYPDFVAVCGQLEYEVIERMPSLINPTLIVEVLSASTERRDRGSKWLAYKTLPSLSAYLLIHQDRPFIEIFTRIADTQRWEYGEVEGLDSTLILSSIGCQVALAEIYADVEFQEIEEA